MYRWQGISEFIAVVEAQSFTLAAKKLHCSTAHISRSIQQLEARLETRLFFRTTRKVTPTEAGESYYQDCRHLADAILDAENAIKQTAKIPRGMIKITAPVTYGEQILMPYFIEFMRQYPKVQLEIQLSNQTLDLIDSGIDLAVRFGQLNNSTLICKRIGQRKLVICASEKYIRKHGKPDTLSSLDDFNCLSGNAKEWLFCQNGKTFRHPIHGNLKCNSGKALLIAAKSDLGLVQLPEEYVQAEILSGELIPLFTEFQEVKEDIWVLYPHRQFQPRRITLLIEFLKSKLIA